MEKKIISIEKPNFLPCEIYLASIDSSVIDRANSMIIKGL